MRLLYLSVFIAASLSARGQDSSGALTGRIFDNITDSVLQEVNVRNLRTNALSRSGAQGNYRISAFEGDKLVFSLVGYHPDTLVVQFHMFNTVTDIGLFRDSSLLDPVTINAPNYQADSIARRLEYQHIFESQANRITRNGEPDQGFGIKISPFSYFSKSARDQRKLKKNLVRQEEDAYIDFRFSAAYVGRVTGLSGEELRSFMQQYRPSHEFARKANQQDMLLYINDHLKKFRKVK